jgi:pimeloyl-ACP methyl ester carboxylesterase
MAARERWDTELRSNRAATRVDAAARRDDPTGHVEVLGFVGEHERVFTAATLPAPNATASPWGIVICPSIAHELVKNYRREVVLARALAALGVASVRLQYRGTGNSDGETSDLTYDSMRADVADAVRQLGELGGVDRVAFVGSRFGALVGASAACQRGGAPLVFVEPVTSADRYVREGFRARAMQSIASRSTTTTGQLAEELEREGFIDVLGVALHREFCHSWAGRTLVGELAQQPVPVLVLHLGGDQPQRELTRLGDDLRARGHEVTVEDVRADETWWYLDERELLDIGTGSAPSADAAVGVDGPPGTPALVAGVCRWVQALEVS